MGNICNRLSHTHALTYKVQTSLILCRKDCSLRQGMSAKFPGGGGAGRYDHMADSLLVLLVLKLDFYICCFGALMIRSPSHGLNNF